MFQKLSLFLKFFLNEFFKLKSKIFFLKNFFKEISLFKLLSFYISKNEFPFRNIDLNKYLEKNTKIWKNTESYSQNKLLVDLTLSSHPLYAIRNCLISKEISKHKKYEIVVLLNRYDFYSYFIAYSFGIRNFIFFDFGNFLIRMYNYLRILKFIDYENLQKNLVKLKYKKFDLGMAAYEHTLRNFLKTIPTDKHNYLFCIALSQALYSAEKSNKIFKKFKIASFVLSELQYIPNRLFFTQALRKKIPVYAGVGGNDAEDLTVRIYNNIKDINSIKSKFSKNLVNFLKKNKSLKKKTENYFLKENFKAKMGYEETFIKNKHIKKPKIIKFKSKNDFSKYFNIDTKKKNILILPHVLNDNLFTAEWSIFDTPFVWFVETLKRISQIKNVNWIIKPHPSENLYKEGQKIKSIFDKYIKQQSNIILLDSNLVVSNIEKFISCALTSHGSAGYQFTSLGIPVITTADASYSNFNFTLQPKTKKKYFNLISNLNKINPVDKNKIYMAKLYWFVYKKICRSKHNLLLLFDSHSNFNKKNFWKLTNKINNKKNREKNEFCEDFRIQIKNENRHITNFKILGLKNYEKFKLYDI